MTQIARKTAEDVAALKKGGKLPVNRFIDPDTKTLELRGFGFIDESCSIQIDELKPRVPIVLTIDNIQHISVDGEPTKMIALIDVVVYTKDGKDLGEGTLTCMYDRR